MNHAETLRGLLSRGLARDEALVELRDSGVSPVACVKALIEVETLKAPEAKRLVDWLNSTPRGLSSEPVAEECQRKAASPRESVVRALSSLIDPPADVEATANNGSWYSSITVREGDVLWRVVCERSVWRLEVAPAWAPTESFDADLLARHYIGRGLSPVKKGLDDLMAITPADLVARLDVIRQAVIDGFREDTWVVTRARLRRLGHERDFELFGRPMPPG